METLLNAQTQAPNLFIIHIMQSHKSITKKISVVNIYENILFHEQIFLNILRVHSNFEYLIIFVTKLSI